MRDPDVPDWANLSLPDSWAIDQLFPIVPIHRLDEEPLRRGTLQDVTCDSDGKIDRFVGEKGGNPSLELHEFRDGEPYMLGVFLTGAYQEILGDLHNLFGDTNAVHVELTDTGYQIGHVIKGDSVSEVLRYVEYVPEISQHPDYEAALAALKEVAKE
jgi:arginine decarboxylase